MNIAKIGEPLKAVWELKLGSRQDIETLVGYETHTVAGAGNRPRQPARRRAG